MVDAIQVSYDIDDVKAMVGDSKKIKGYLTTTISQYVGVHNRLHVSLALGVHHTLVNGDPCHLNRLYSSLRVNDQTALKRFVAEHCRFPMVVDGSETMALWLNFSAKEGNLFVVRKGTTEQRAELAKEQDIAYWLGKPYFANSDVSKPQDYDLLAKIKSDLAAVEKKMKKANETGEFVVIAEKSLCNELNMIINKYEEERRIKHAKEEAEASKVSAERSSNAESVAEEKKEVEKTLKSAAA